MTHRSLLLNTVIGATNDLMRANGLQPAMRRPLSRARSIETLVYFENEIFGEGDYIVEYDHTPADESTGAGQEIDLRSVSIRCGRAKFDVLALLCETERERITAGIAEQIAGYVA